MGGVSVAGLRPGLGRGGITHSFEVMEPGVPGPGDGATDGRAASAGAIDMAGAIAGAGVSDTPVEAMVMAKIKSGAGVRLAGTVRGGHKSGGLGGNARAGSRSEERKCAHASRRARKATQKGCHRQGIELGQANGKLQR